MTETSAATRIVAGAELPATGVWRLDPGHAEIGFVGRHFLLTKVRGRFTGVEGTVEVAENPADSKVTVVIDMASVTSGDDARDTHLKSADFFDVADHATATFASTAVDWDGTSGSMVGVRDAIERDAPDPGDGAPGVLAFPGRGEHRRGVAPEQVEVGGGRDTGLAQVRTGLFHRQWQPPQLLAQPGRRRRVRVRPVRAQGAGQQFLGVDGCEDVQ
ncbi:MAG TPA: YceI family protein [Pseudonocardiaceae bacterium]|nr:YceI family protein [Pseudonocardiaceae bacterium]